MADADLNLLFALDALLAEGSVSGAARQLGLSASAMSRTLARLRAATGDPLLVRAGRGLVPTPHAAALRARVGDLARDVRTVLGRTAKALDLASLERSFTIRANEGFVDAFAGRLVTAARQAAPGVRLRFAPKPDKDVRPLREGLIDPGDRRRRGHRAGSAHSGAVPGPFCRRRAQGPRSGHRQDHAGALRGLRSRGHVASGPHDRSRRSGPGNAWARPRRHRRRPQLSRGRGGRLDNGPGRVGDAFLHCRRADAPSHGRSRCRRIFRAAGADGEGHDLAAMAPAHGRRSRPSLAPWPGDGGLSGAAPCGARASPELGSALIEGRVLPSASRHAFRSTCRRESVAVFAASEAAERRSTNLVVTGTANPAVAMVRITGADFRRMRPQGGGSRPEADRVNP